MMIFWYCIMIQKWYYYDYDYKHINNCMKSSPNQHKNISDHSFFAIDNISAPKYLGYNFKFESYSADHATYLDDDDNYLNPEFKTNIINLFCDMFPYYKIESSVTIILIIEIIVYLIFPEPYLIIRPYYRITAEFSSIIGWLMNPFVCDSLA